MSQNCRRNKSKLVCFIFFHDLKGSFPGNLQLVLVLKPSRLLQRAIADVSMRLHRDDFKLKVPVSMLLSVWTFGTPVHSPYDVHGSPGVFVTMITHPLNY